MAQSARVVAYGRKGLAIPISLWMSLMIKGVDFKELIKDLNHITLGEPVIVCESERIQLIMQK